MPPKRPNFLKVMFSTKTSPHEAKKKRSEDDRKFVSRGGVPVHLVDGQASSLPAGLPVAPNAKAKAEASIPQFQAQKCP
jgi:hypothetical protein